MNTNTLPFLKWAGGKRWLVAKHSEWLRRDATRYIEPFLGSGAVFFHIQPKRAILNDLNEELIITYQSLRDEPHDVWRLLKAHQRKHSTEYYYYVRNQRLRSPTRKAARFIYLNRTCFNGIYRVNLQGDFNVPKGTKNSVILPEDNFPFISKLLHPAKISSLDFSHTIAKAKTGDFLYVDPPYTVKHNKNNFIKYNESIFSWADQVRLANLLIQAAKRGACMLISNADHPCIHNLYRSNIWKRITVDRFSGVASSSKYRKGTTEVIISNYLTNSGNQVDPRG
ncbi:MAG: Dam family site-specific DNA-(adenine-N6)-methyltransferase [Candidatus Thiodiazotropha sp.]